MVATPKKLTPKQRAFVSEYVACGNPRKAALRAGYRESTARFDSPDMLRIPYVAQAIREETQRALDAAVPIGKKVLYDLAMGAKSEAVRLQAGLALLDRGGLRLKQIHEHTHTVKDARTDEELRQRVVELSRELGLTPSRLIEGERLRDPVAIEAELLPVLTPDGLSQPDGLSAPGALPLDDLLPVAESDDLSPPDDLSTLDALPPGGLSALVFAPPK